MAFRFNKYFFLILSVVCFLLAALTEHGVFDRFPERKLLAEFQKQLTEKERLLENRINAIVALSAGSNFSSSYMNEMAPFSQMLEKEGTGFLIYKNGELIYWSDRAIAFRDRLPLNADSASSIILFPNGYYLTRSKTNDSLTIYGLILIKYNYSHENKFLRNDFSEEFKLPDTYRLVKAGSPGSLPVYNLESENIFSVVSEGKIYNKPRQMYLPALLYLAGLIMLIIYARRVILEINGGALVRLLITGSYLFFLYWLHILFHIPGVFSQIGFFSPAQFALSEWLPSLGDFFLVSFFAFYLMLNAFRDFRIHHLEQNSGIRRTTLILILFIFTATVYHLVDYFIGQLIFNSSFSFALNQINEITLPTVIGITSIMLLLIGLVLLTLRLADEARKIIPVKLVALFLFISAALPGLVRYSIDDDFHILVILFYLLTVTISLFYSSRTNKKYGMSYLVLFISLIAIYSVDVIYRITEKKEREIMKLMAVTLVAEHDPAAEVFLVEIQEQINIDPNIPRYLIPPFTNLDEYLEITYFSGFFRQYDLQITLCTGSDSVILQPQNTMTPCFPFFEEMINNQGIPLPGTNFYYMDNMDGRITYFGKLHYPLSSDSIGVSVFIELKSKIQSEGIGFPELLIDRSMQKPASYKRFDYAKYFGGELVDKHGNYPYNYYIYSYNFEDSEYSFNNWDGYEHLIYRTREDNYVIVSRSIYNFIDFLISFPYLFVFYFLGSLAIIPLIRPSYRKWKIMFDLKFRIQAAIISIVFVSLLLVALSTIFYNVEESRSRLQEDLDQKMNSISAELDLQLENIKAITPEMSEWLMPELVRLSNIFQTDINIYGVDGDMIVSSRPEIFNRGLVSRRINTQAYHELFENFQTNYFQPEKIGGLRYLSAYEPIINSNGDYLGFINLPYFTHQDKYSQEISTFIVAFINLYVLLFLASIVIAVFIANQITLPLVIIRENLRKIELGKRNEPINYDKEDEIGKLVKEYNKKVDELAVSAELLARSERESAWREMAKQVAHEIKNPLTPMKLNIQHLQRFRGEGTAYREYVDRISQTLITQIDNLSDIATEFSNFAKIPTAMKQVFRLADHIGKVIELFENHDRVKIRFDKGNCGKLMVNADREQVSRALINLIKNGIQAIPEEREGVVSIALQRKEHMITLSVTDNGTGIATELQEKMFSPNFTTKTSGMGLGLAIVKNIAENFNGRVWYETVIHEGTTFYLDIPVYEEPGISDNV